MVQSVSVASASTPIGALAALRALARCAAGRVRSAPAAASICSTRKTSLPDEPADKLYNEGLFLLNQKNDFKDAAKKFEEVDRQHPYSEWARKSLLMSRLCLLRGQGIRRLRQRGEALRHAASRQPGRGLCAIPDRLVLFRPDPRRHARPGSAPKRRSPRWKRSSANIPDTEYAVERQARRSKLRATSSPARKWRSAATI